MRVEPLPTLVVMISGSGTNLQALLDACARGDLPARVGLVVSNRRDAFGLERAARAGVPTLYMPLRGHREAGRSREDYDADLARAVRELSPRLVVLAGWMHVFSTQFLKEFPERVVNLHPALPGAFDGVDAIKRAWEAARRGDIDHTGVMVHHVVPAVDAGPVILQERVPILPGEPLADLEARVHSVEHRLIVEAVRRVLDGPAPPVAKEPEHV